jgi:hypothetical protein
MLKNYLELLNSTSLKYFSKRIKTFRLGRPVFATRTATRGIKERLKFHQVDQCRAIIYQESRGPLESWFNSFSGAKPRSSELGSPAN